MDMQQDELREILEEFFTEAEESLEQLEQDLIKLEDLSVSGTTDTETVDRIFRVLHTLKGGAGFLGLDKIAKIAHAGENLLDEVRGGRVAIDKPVMDALLETNDNIKELLQCQKVGESDEGKENLALIERLEVLACADNPPAPAPAAAAPAPEPAVEPEPAPPAPEPVQEPVVEPEPAPVADAPIDAGLVNQDLLSEVMGDDTLDPSRDTGMDELLSPTGGAPDAAAAPTPAVEPEPAPVADAPVAAPVEPEPAASGVSSDLLNEVMGDDSLDPSKDPEAVEAAAAAPVVAAVEEPAPQPAESGVNSDLLNEVMGDDSLDPAKDPEAVEVADASTAPVPAAEPEASAPAAAIPEIKRGDAPQERRQGPSEERRQPEERRSAPGRRMSDASNETIRVEVTRLDKVMNLVGELVLARNSLVSQLNQPETRQVMENLPNHTLIQSSIEQLSRVTQDLQMSVLSTRMQPIKKVFDKIPRQVRDLKTKLAREVDLVIEGEMTEVDKSLVEELSDPMVHMIRNALDHGIEPPADRKAAGKHPTGTLTVRAFYEGNNVVVQVQEDGKGIDPAVIRKIAVKKGIISETAAAVLSDEEAVRLILAPGFSTAEVVSDVSGRGVGMDVVNSKIASLKGTLDIRSELGFGTTFSIYLPLTLAIVQALVVASNKEGFAIPIGDISEVIQFDPESIHSMNNQDVIELRGDALPLFYLSQLTARGFIPPQVKAMIKASFQQPAKPKEGEEVSMDDLEQAAAHAASALDAEGAVSTQNMDLADVSNGFVVVVRDGSNSLGLVVDKLIGQEEAVVKPVTEMFQYHEAVSGATITGDGTVHMILDVPYMLKHMAAKA